MSDAGGWILLLGRILIGLNFIAIAGGAHLTKGPMFVGFARQMGFPAPFLASWVSGLWLVAGGASITLGIWADLGALMIAAFVIPAALWFHRFWAIDDESQKQTATLLFWRNVTFLGAALALFAFFAAFGQDLPLTITDPLLDLSK
jgi:putative oxidoreductase